MLKKFSKMVATALGALALSGQGAIAAGGMDSENIYGDGLTKSTPIHIHPFTTADADLGNPKFSDTANAMVKSAPHLLASDIVTAMRHARFTAVTLDESEGGKAAGSLNVTGRFTRLDPGSQNLRVWIGFGAGESKVCISGEVTDPDGKKLADFADCRNGLGWGSSEPQSNKGAEILGDRVAGFLINWSE